MLLNYGIYLERKALLSDIKCISKFNYILKTHTHFFEVENAVQRELSWINHIQVYMWVVQKNQGAAYESWNIMSGSAKLFRTDDSSLTVGL